jgi:IS30 family transposase
MVDAAQRRTTMGRIRGGHNVTNAERREIRCRIAAGQDPSAVADAVGRKRRTVFTVLEQAGGLALRRRARSELRLSLAEREEISRGLRAGESYRAIARRLGRAPSTVMREVRALGRGRHGYRAWRAELRRDRRARRPRASKLARNGRLRRVVEQLLLARWSPEQISRRLRRDYADDPTMQVSPETIYQSLFVQSRGALRRELAACLRTGRARRRPRGRNLGGEIRDMVLISERPAEIEDRAVPGHWEGDLIIGRDNRSAIATLVERRTRFVMLVALPGGHSAPYVRTRLAEQILTLPAQLRRSLTWDRGKEMADHVRFTIETGIAVYFCDPHSPWQRGSNENTNGLLRQYFPRGTELRLHDQAHLDAVASELNGRPRQTLDWLKPCEVLAELLR